MMVSQNESRTIFTMLSYVFAIVFVLHVMISPIWFGIHSLVMFETDNRLFAVVPLWFVCTGLLSLVIAITLAWVPNKSRETRR